MVHRLGDCPASCAIAPFFSSTMGTCLFYAAMLYQVTVCMRSLRTLHNLYWCRSCRKAVQALYGSWIGVAECEQSVKRNWPFKAAAADSQELKSLVLVNCRSTGRWCRVVPHIGAASAKICACNASKAGALALCCEQLLGISVAGVCVSCALVPSLRKSRTQHALSKCPWSVACAESFYLNPLHSCVVCMLW